MTYNNRMNPEDRFLTRQEHRKISRLWNRAIQKLSLSRTNISQDFLQEDPNENNDDGKRGVRFGQEKNPSLNLCQCPGDVEGGGKKLPSDAIKKKLGKGKSMVKIKSPLQKFDEAVSKELTSRRMSEEGGMPSFEGSKNWPSLQFSGSKLLDFGHSKISVENKVSRGALHSVVKNIKDEDPSDGQDAAFMDAIEKLAQAQAFCRFDAAVKAAEAATASVPPEKAEEAAMACTKDYQSEIVDVINEKISMSEEKKPMEVIGYIGVTKLKD